MKKIRSTHIICTMGPAVESVDLVRSLIRQGMNIARFNFSHGDHAYHAAGIARVRKAAALEKTPIALLLDTKGPEIRTGMIREGGNVNLVSGEEVEVIAAADAEKLYGKDEVYTRQGRIIVSYELLADDIKTGARILIADGLFSLKCTGIEGRSIRCLVESGGELGSRKNVNVLGVYTRLPAMSPRDQEDLRFGHEQGMDCVAASFIRKARDVITIQQYLASIGSDMPVIAKIEDDEGLRNVEEIIRVSAGIMVARGDLGVQIAPERVPLEQKRIIGLCNNEGKPVITATQMLDSMIRNPQPTRAESGDVANAILDGTDCVMLSGETASGAYPEAAVAVMDRIARTVEASDVYERNQNLRRLALKKDGDLGHAIAESAVLLADTIDAACIITPTMTGNTSQLVSRFRPSRPILGASPSEKIRRRLLLHWGVVPLEVKREEDTEAVIQGALSAAIKANFAKTSDKVVFTAGIPVNSPFTANHIRVHVIGKILGRGRRGFGGHCTGRVVKAANLEEASLILRSRGGEILLTHTLDMSFIPVIRICRGIILEGSSELSQDLLKTVNPNVVYVAQVVGAMNRLEENLTVTLDGTEKIIYEGTLE
ncbi:MAG: pyruvate kinase [Spirochaetaceae bacterium]|nr:pyruvate kinase [Spirochaetaceae bacterium]